MNEYKNLSRRDFLKLSSLGAVGTALSTGPWRRQSLLRGIDGSHQSPFPPGRYEYEPVTLGRVAYESISVFELPKVDARQVAYKFRDDLLNIYETFTSEDGPLYNPIWHRIWGGYVHSSFIQPVDVRLNAVRESVPSYGLLTEVSVPYSQPYNYTSANGWEKNDEFYLYYQSTHWITDVVEGPDKQPWYQITDELDGRFKYYLPGAHLRAFDFDELQPISPDVPSDDKWIEVNLLHQTLTAYEGDTAVFNTDISSGTGVSVPQGSLPTKTPVGTHYIESKMPSKHMGETRLTDSLGDVSLPGVPWTMFFAEGGYALHGAYWHSNFGTPMSRGCVNLSMVDSRWLFRWTTPVWRPEEVVDESGWEKRGRGTRVEVVEE